MKCKRTVLPLLGTAFEPGRLADTLNEFEDEELAEAYLCEIYRVYYTGGLMSEAMEQLNNNGVIFETKDH